MTYLSKYMNVPTEIPMLSNSDKFSNDDFVDNTCYVGYY